MKLYILLMILTLSPGLAAQRIGDEVRVNREGVWVKGWIKIFEPDGTFLIRDRFPAPGSTFQVSEVNRADWYKPRSLARDLLMGVGMSVLIEVVFPCNNDPGTFGRSCLYVNDRGREFTYAVILGAGIGLLIHAIKPGDWTRWIENGIVVP